MSSSSGSSLGGSSGPMSASAIVATSAYGSHVLKIEGYSRTQGLGTGKFISSRSFEIGGHRWCLRYYPDGDGRTGIDSGDASCFTIFVCLDPSEAGQVVRAQARISLVDQQGHPVDGFVRQKSGYSTFSAKPVPEGSYHTINKAVLHQRGFLSAGDAFSVRCDITVVTGIHTVDVAIPSAQRGFQLN